MTFRRTDVNLLRATNLGRWVYHHFAPVGDPSWQSAHRKECGEHLWREPHGLLDTAGIEVNVWVELAFDEVRVGKSRGLKLLGNVEQRVIDTQLG